jgi:hypothetical protein
VTAARLIGIFRTWRADRERFCAGSAQHTRWPRRTGDLRGFNWLNLGSDFRLRRWSGFLMKLRLNIGRRRGLRNGDIFRRRSRLVRGRFIQSCDDSSRGDIGKIWWRRFFMERKSDGDAVHRQGPAKGSKHLPFRRRGIKKRTGHGYLGPGTPLSASLLISKAIL